MRDCEFLDNHGFDKVIGQMKLDTAAGGCDVDVLRVQFKTMENHQEALRVGLADRHWDGLRSVGCLLVDLKADPTPSSIGIQHSRDADAVRYRSVQQILNLTGKIPGQRSKISSFQFAERS